MSKGGNGVVFLPVLGLRTEHAAVIVDLFCDLNVCLYG
jgi:hypothetical protein